MTPHKINAAGLAVVSAIATAISFGLHDPVVGFGAGFVAATAITTRMIGDRLNQKDADDADA